MHLPIGETKSSTPLTIESILARNPDLPVMPAAAMRVMKVTNEGGASAQDVADQLALDTALAARVLRLANSAFYGLSREVSSLKDGVVLLGFSTVRQLAIVASTLPMLRRPLPGYCMGPGQLLLHSTGIGIGAKILAKMSKKADPEDAFIAGLLADIGKIAMTHCFDHSIASLVTLGTQAGMTFDAVERQVIGFDHAEVGAAMTEQWNLPERISSAIRFHHKPSESEEPRALADCLHLADYMTMACGFGLGGDGLCYEIDEQALVRLGLSAEDLDVAVNEFVTAYEHQEALYQELSGA